MQLFSVVLAALSAPLASAHFSITYPYWRGNSYPTQWTYPCGGVNQSVSDTNRTIWPISGGALVFTPSHDNAQTFVNIGLGGNVTSLNISLMPTFNQTGNGTFCFPKLTLPPGLNITEGSNATIQVIQLTHNGGALYNCADITFKKDAPPVPEGMCKNSTGVGISPFYSTGTCVPQNPPGTATATATGSSSSVATGSGAKTPATGAMGVRILTVACVLFGMVAW